MANDAYDPQPISAAKRAANQRNAQASTGPRTAAGKRIASRNRTVHGLRAADPVLPGEEDDFEVFAAAIRDALPADDVLEACAVERIIIQEWRLARIITVETGLIAYQQAEDAARIADAVDFSARTPIDPRIALGRVMQVHLQTFMLLQRYETALTHLRAAAYAEYQALRRRRRPEPTTPAAGALVIDVPMAAPPAPAPPTMEASPCADGTAAAGPIDESDDPVRADPGSASVDPARQAVSVDGAVLAGVPPETFDAVGESDAPPIDPTVEPDAQVA